MRILEVINIGYEAGGAEKSVKLIADNLKRQGHDVRVISTDRNAQGKVTIADELLPPIGGSAAARFLGYFWSRQMYLAFRRIVRDYKPDVVHLHTIGEFSPSIVWALGKIPVILTVHGPEDYTLKLLPWNLPPSDYKNNSYQWKDITFRGRLRYCYLRYLQRPAYLLSLRRLKVVLAPSMFMAEALTADFPETKIRQLYNGIDLPKKIALPAENAKTILYVGRLESVKGVDYLIRALSEVHKTVPGVRLRIVGDGSQSASLRALAKQLKLESYIDFAGWVAQKDIFREYAATDMLVIPSVWPENLPTVAIEALAVGRPIVGTKTGGIPELVDDTVNGFIVEPRDASALTAAILPLLTDSTLAHNAARNSITKSRMFDSSVFIEHLIKIYEGYQ